MAVFLTGCPKVVPIPETSFDDLEKVRSLTAEEEAANAKVLSDYDKKEEIGINKSSEEIDFSKSSLDLN